MDIETPDPATASDIAALVEGLSRLADACADVAGLLLAQQPSSFRPPMAVTRRACGPETIVVARGVAATDDGVMTMADWERFLALHDEAPPHGSR